jgi:type II secretory pathway pseudopilin PulG
VTPLRATLAAVAAVPLLAACSGADALEAQQLLAQAQQAQQSVTSQTFSAHVTVELKGEQVSIQLTGGGYLKGEHAGDMYMEMSFKVPEGLGTALPFDSLEVAHVGGRTWMDLGGKRVELPASAFGTATSSGGADPLGSFDLTRYVKAVAVAHGDVLNGKPVTKITGVLDTAAMIQGLSALGSAGSAAGLPDLGGHVGDTRAVLYIDDATHLLVAALADVSMDSDEGKLSMHLDVATTGVDQPVQLPS